MEIIRTGLGSRFEHPKWNTHDRCFIILEDSRVLEGVRLSWDIDVSFVVSPISKKK